MDSEAILQLVDLIHREKEIDKEIIFMGLEHALSSAVKKKYGPQNKIQVSIDRDTGEIFAYRGEQRIDTQELGRLAALTAKQIILQKIREAERDVLYREYIHKVGELVVGTVRRFEGRDCMVSFGRVEGVLPKREQIPGEHHRIGHVVKAVILDVKRVGQKLFVYLSRIHPIMVRRLFELEVPEVAEKIVEIKSVARIPGKRTKIAVTSRDLRVDSLGACVGLRGSRIKNVVEELGGEKIDIVRWNQDPEIFILNALKPAEVLRIDLDYDLKKAYVMVSRDQLSLAIGRKGMNVQLVSALTGWEVDVYSEDEEGQMQPEVDESKLEVEEVKEKLLSGGEEEKVAEIDEKEVEEFKRTFIEQGEGAAKGDEEN